MIFRTAIRIKFRNVAFCVFFVCGALSALFTFSSLRAGGVVLTYLLSPITIAVNLTDHRACEITSALQPNIVFIGDSHTGVGWHFAEVSRRLNLEVGACSLGGAAIAEVAAMADFFSNQNDKKPYIVIGFAPRMFWIGENHDQREQAIETKISQIKDPLNFWAFTLPEILVWNRYQADSEKRLELSFQKFNKWAEKASKKSLEKNILASNQKSIKKWRRRLIDFEVDTTYNVGVQKLCEIHLSGLAKIVITYIPESPILRSMYLEKHMQPMIDSFRTLKACGATVFESSLDYSSQNSHFLTTLDISGLDNKSASKDFLPANWFDADHLNFYGAKIHTRWFIDQINFLGLLDH